MTRPRRTRRTRRTSNYSTAYLAGVVALFAILAAALPEPWSWWGACVAGFLGAALVSLLAGWGR